MIITAKYIGLLDLINDIISVIFICSIFLLSILSYIHFSNNQIIFDNTVKLAGLAASGTIISNNRIENNSSNEVSVA